MNMYSHGLTKADGQAIKLRIQGEGRKEPESRKAKKQNECHVNKGITTWESVNKEYGLI